MTSILQLNIQVKVTMLYPIKPSPKIVSWLNANDLWSNGMTLRLIRAFTTHSNHKPNDPPIPVLLAVVMNRSPIGHSISEPIISHIICKREGWGQRCWLAFVWNALWSWWWDSWAFSRPVELICRLI